MERQFRNELKQWEIGLIIPVPLHASRKRRRGFNQAEIIADELSQLTGIPSRNDLLFRIRRTEPQKVLGENERRQNLLRLRPPDPEEQVIS
ncbi:MAG TPA: hypothetical protein H9695_05450 [Candidatus Mediterraneibacter excrementigallinarum]|nr:hypothetical protein [Candidatus Mediterraneibacter excrementigallinarum]